MTKKEYIEELASALMLKPCGELYAVTKHLSEQDNEAVTRRILALNNSRLMEARL